MSREGRACELWREREWSCEQGVLDGRRQLRLYLNGQLMDELATGAGIDLFEQSTQWRNAVRALLVSAPPE
jgi:hypothetical protein